MKDQRLALIVLLLTFITLPSWLKGVGNFDQILSFNVTRYNDVEVKILDHTLDLKKFEEQLINALVLWKKRKIKAVMLSIPNSSYAYLPIALKHDFKIQHATSEQIVLTMALVNSSFHPFPKTILSVAAIVIDNNKILVVKDKYESLELGGFGYKLPGGYVNYGEHIQAAAVREVKEETGIDTEFESVIAFRHTHNQWWEMESMSKLYFCCVLKPLSTKINYENDELIHAKWMDFDEFRKTTKGVFAEFVQIFEQNNSLFIGVEQDRQDIAFYKAKKR